MPLAYVRFWRTDGRKLPLVHRQSLLCSHPYIRRGGTPAALTLLEVPSEQLHTLSPLPRGRARAASTVQGAFSRVLGRHFIRSLLL